ncbi:MAG: transposase [Bacteroidia bacterium]
MKGSFPCHVEIFKTKQALCEDKTTPCAILNYKFNTENIIVFDRGVQSRKTFEKFSENQIQFVTRIKTDVLFKIISSNTKTLKPDNSSVTIKNDLTVLLKNADSKWILTPMRLIQAVIDKTGEDIYFLTNIEDLSAYEIAFVYKQRLDIEVFFKFLKQELNLGHIVSRNENGITVIIYMTFILSILLIAYKKLNKLDGYKIPKLNFSHELEAYIIKEIVILCGGNPFKMKHLFNDD